MTNPFNGYDTSIPAPGVESKDTESPMTNPFNSYDAPYANAGAPPYVGAAQQLDAGESSQHPNAEAPPYTSTSQQLDPRESAQYGNVETLPPPTGTLPPPAGTLPPTASNVGTLSPPTPVAVTAADTITADTPTNFVPTTPVAAATNFVPGSRIDELGVYYMPGLAQSRVKQRHTSIIMRLISTGLSVGAFALIGWFSPGAGYSWWMIGVCLLIGAAFLTWDCFGLRRDRINAKLAAVGLAMGLNRTGILFQQQWFGWNEIAKLQVRPKARAFRLTLTTRDGRSCWLPLSDTDIKPATLDTAVLTMSNGQTRVDLSRLDV